MDKAKGITLIALVVTIIVLIILAAVSMNLLLGDSGIITKTIEASKVFNVGEIKEKIGLKILGGETYTISDLDKDNIKYEKVTDTVVIVDDEMISLIEPAKVFTEGVASDWGYEVINPTTCRVYDYKKKNDNPNIVIPDYIIDENNNKYVVTQISGPGAEITSKFRESTIIESVIIPSSVEIIQHYSFYKCTNLKKVVIPNSVIQIGDAVFAYASNLEEANLSTNLITLGKEVFRECRKLKNITIPTKITDIPEYTFFNCVGLTSIDIPSNIIKVGKEAFAYCGDVVADNFIGIEGNLVKIVLNTGLEQIEEGAFRGLGKANVDITIPSTVTVVGDNAFHNFGRRGEASIYIAGPIASEAASAFSNCFNVIR